MVAMRLVEFVNLNPYQADKICVSLITFHYHRLHIFRIEALNKFKKTH